MGWAVRGAKHQETEGSFPKSGVLLKGDTWGYAKGVGFPKIRHTTTNSGESNGKEHGT